MNTKSNSSKALLARAYALSNDEETKALYQDWASTYDETMLDGLSYLTPLNTASLLAATLTDKSALILDVGSGTGLAGRQHNGKQVYSHIIQADLNSEIDLKNNTYDAIICTGLFTHAHVGAGCLPELFRILKPSGFFATTIHKDVWDEGGFDEQIKKLTKFKPNLAGWMRLLIMLGLQILALLKIQLLNVGERLWKLIWMGHF